MYPQLSEYFVPSAVTPTLSDYGIAYNHIARQAILQIPVKMEGTSMRIHLTKDLGIARMIGMVTYRNSDMLFDETV